MGIPEFMPAERAIAVAATLLSRAGFMQVSETSNRNQITAKSKYFRKMPNWRKIRISDHPLRCAQHDITVDLLIREPTIRPDIEYRVRKAIMEYEKNARPKKD